MTTTAPCAVPMVHDYTGWRRRLSSGLHGTILELGAGDGANTAYLSRDLHWIGLEPDARRAADARRTARGWFAHSSVLECRAEAIPLADASVDAVLGTLLLCSVRDQARVLSEIRRVLRPGGGFRFLEHVAAPRGTWMRRLELAATPWSVLTDHGCHPARDTGSALDAAGFATVTALAFTRPGPWGRRVDHLAGEAVTTQ
ncbi:methyltransferase domain-containing protein [Knoellia koreensis]|uniref:Class I SAM-dependent methyltransferase n=1 Tax=Knoellia koreensis TaxID=2730921 RepID=A0A849HHF5_9MICO|nr:class I SAM-dependent methyltransferase [Knoellia sp. DB2414S]